MKQTIRLFLVALFAGAITLGSYKLLEEKEVFSYNSQPISNYIPTNYASRVVDAAALDFTEAAEKTVHAVVHVKNTTVSRQPTNIFEFFQGGGQPRAMIGSGSGVIISPDGYIVTNNHVIANAASLEVTLNNNRTYPAKLIGADPATDIALIKIEDSDLPYIPFGDSNDLRLGEWVLAVGNPFNLTSTVTAGIISAKARDLNQFDGNPQSFIQTDAAVNRGNSGGALVNTRGELIGINTAITSETGSYVGYSFAVPSNNARKVIEDILEFGNVQRGILGIQVGNLSPQLTEKYGIDETQGVYIGGIEKGSGADIAGLRQGDIIKQLDGYKVTKFADLSTYLGSKRPNDVVNVTVLRDGKEKTLAVTLVKLEVFSIDDLGLEVKNMNNAELKSRGLKNGVLVTRALSPEMAQYKLEGIIITQLNDQTVKDIDDVRNIMSKRNPRTPIKMTFLDTRGTLNTFIFR